MVTNHLFRSFGIGALVFGAALLLGSCSSAPMQAYSGPALPMEQTALITSGFHTDLISVDGVKVPGTSAAVLPGPHTVVIRPGGDVISPYGYRQDYFFYSLVDGAVNFTAQAGHTYRAEVVISNATPEMADQHGNEFKGNVGYGLGATGFVWTGYIQDRTAETRIAMTGPLPLQAEPRGTRSGGGDSSSFH